MLKKLCILLSIAVLVATIAIAMYDNSALLASRHGTTGLSPPMTGHASGALETNGTARYYSGWMPRSST